MWIELWEASTRRWGASLEPPQPDLVFHQTGESVTGERKIPIYQRQLFDFFYATRGLSELVVKGLLARAGAYRSSRYALAIPGWEWTPKARMLDLAFRARANCR